MHDFGAGFREQLWELFRLRRDVRRFSSRSVEPALLRHCLEAAHMAPSVGLSQPWRFVLVDSPERRQLVIAEFERANEEAAAAYGEERAHRYRALKLAGLREAPVHLLVCVEREPAQGKGLGRQTQPETVRDSVALAIENLWLAARSYGIGVGWVSILEPERLLPAFELPEQWDWLAYLCIGWPQRDSDAPELESAGWERRESLERRIVRR